MKCEAVNQFSSLTEKRQYKRTIIELESVVHMNNNYVKPRIFLSLCLLAFKVQEIRSIESSRMDHFLNYYYSKRCIDNEFWILFL